MRKKGSADRQRDGEVKIKRCWKKEGERESEKRRHGKGWRQRKREGWGGNCRKQG